MVDERFRPGIMETEHKMHTHSLELLSICLVVLLTLGTEQSLAGKAGRGGDRAKQSATSQGAVFDLSLPAFDPPDCPAWAKEKLPDWVAPFIGANGLTDPWRVKKHLSDSTKGIDRYQANHFVFDCPQTRKYLYTDYTPLTVNYVKGTLPSYEKLAAKLTVGCTNDTDKAVAMLHAMPTFFRHPVMPPCGVPAKADRNLDDEALLASGCGWCNEQARVFARLCQVSGIPARIIHLFGQNHTIAEFYADGRWALADASNMFVVRGPDGKLLSVADCHDGAAGQHAYAVTKAARMAELLKMSDQELGMTADTAKKYREKPSLSIDELSTRKIAFGVMNYPLPK